MKWIIITLALVLTSCGAPPQTQPNNPEVHRVGEFLGLLPGSNAGLYRFHDNEFNSTCWGLVYGSNISISCLPDKESTK